MYYEMHLMQIDCMNQMHCFQLLPDLLGYLYSRIYCLLWLHELDDDWNPIDESGVLVRPGKRICGLKDCVKKSHVIESDEQ